MGDIGTSARSLPNPLPAYGRYQPTKPSRGRVHVSGQVASFEGTLLETGQVGDTVSVDRGRECARQCALNVLAVLNRDLNGLDTIEAVEKVTVFVASAHDFSAQHQVADAASAVFLDYLGERGEHARSAVGVVRLPMNSPVEVEATVLVRDT